MLYPAELRGLERYEVYEKSFFTSTDFDDRDIRRRTLYPAELQKHKYKAGRMILMRSALYNNLSGKKNQVLFLNKHPVERPR